MKKFLICWAAFSLAILSPLFSQTYEDLNDYALAAVEQDSLSQAEEYILRALQLEPANPRNAFLFSNLGTIRRRQGNYEKALESYTYALNMQPLDVSILLNRASLYVEMGRNDRARIDYSLALDIEPDNKEALLARAYIYMYARDYKPARADYERLLKLSPLDYKARLGLATLEQKEGRYQEALSLVNKMIADRLDGEETISSSSLAMLYIMRAGVEYDLQHADLALLDLDEAIRLDNMSPDAYLMRGKIYLVRKRKGEAKRDFEKALSLGIPPAELREFMQQCK